MGDYQRIKNNPYYLPRTLYRRVLSVIRDYDRLCQEVNEVLYSQTEKDNPTERSALLLMKYNADVEAIELALGEIPAEYQTGVINNIRYGKSFPLTADYRTWLRWKQRFVFCVAKNLDLI